MYKLLIVCSDTKYLERLLLSINWGFHKFGEIKTASNGIDGYEIFKKFTPDLIITEFLMPVSSGIEMITKIREIDKNVSVIFTSFNEHHDFTRIAFELSADAYILKTATVEEVENTIIRVRKSIDSKKATLLRDNEIEALLKLAQNSTLYRILYADDYRPSDKVLELFCMSFFKYTCIVKCIIQYEYQNTDIPLEFKDVVRNIFSPILSDFLVEPPSNLIILLETDEGTESIFKKNVKDCCRKLIDYANKHNWNTVMIGISNIYSSLQDAKKMLTEAELSFSSANELNKNNIYFFSGDIGEKNIEFLILKEDLAFLLKNFNSVNLDKFFIKHFPNTLLSHQNNSKALCVSIVTLLQLYFYENNWDFDALFDEPKLIWNKLNNFDSIVNVKQWLKNILLLCDSFINEQASNSSNSIVIRIKDFINNNYDKINNIDSIVSELYISAGYAKTLFKKNTGQSILDYLTEVRIKKAKQLLKDPFTKVYEVSEMVGYKSKTHFSNVFKKETGMNPKDFQKIASVNKAE